MANMAGAGVADDTGSAVVAQVLALFTGIIGTGIYYAVSNDKSPFVRHHVTEALNFTITLAIAWAATIVLSIVLIGFLIMPFLMLWGFIMPILAAVAANKGEWYRYPATLRLVKGPLDQPGGDLRVRGIPEVDLGDDGRCPLHRVARGGCRSEVPGCRTRFRRSRLGLAGILASGDAVS